MAAARDGGRVLLLAAPGQAVLATRRHPASWRKWSRNVEPAYSWRKRPRRCSSGTTRSTKSSKAPGKYAGRMMKPSASPADEPFLAACRQCVRRAVDHPVAARRGRDIVEVAQRHLLAPRHGEQRARERLAVLCHRQFRYRTVERIAGDVMADSDATRGAGRWSASASSAADRVAPWPRFRCGR